MTKLLSESEVTNFRERGYHFPVDVLTESEVAEFRGKLEKSEALLYFRRQRFLDQHVLTSLERLFGEGVVSARRRGYDDGVDRRVAQSLLRIFRNLHIGTMSVHFLQSGCIAIDDPDDFARLFVVEISDEVRPPLASPNHGHVDHLG